MQSDIDGTLNAIKIYCALRAAHFDSFQTKVYAIMCDEQQISVCCLWLKALISIDTLDILNTALLSRSST